MKRRRVLGVASAGGHFVQLMRMAPAWDGCDLVIVTTNPALRDEVMTAAAQRQQPKPRFYSVVEANRWHKFRLLRGLVKIFFIVLWQRPDVIITTGAAPGYFAIRIGKALGIRTAWIDSIANAEELSLSGRMAGRHVDLWLTQWEHLSKEDGPGYEGAVL